MNLRDLYWAYPPYCGLLGRLGGWRWKPLRRYLLPLTGGVLAYMYGVRWWRCLAYTITTAIAFSLGYSPEKHGLWYPAFIGTTYGLTPWCLAFRWAWAWWPLAHGAVFGGLTYASWAWGCPWGLVEVVVFSLHGGWVSWILHRRNA